MLPGINQVSPFHVSDTVFGVCTDDLMSSLQLLCETMIVNFFTSILLMGKLRLKHGMICWRSRGLKAAELKFELLSTSYCLYFYSFPMKSAPSEQDVSFGSSKILVHHFIFLCIFRYSSVLSQVPSRWGDWYQCARSLFSHTLPD